MTSHLGYVAETFSLEALGKVRGWAVIDYLPFDCVDIDHVVITPSTVLAVETKHHGYLPPSHPTAHRRARRDREAALASARKLRSLLRSKKLHDAASVTAVLMIWGPGAPEFEQGYRVVDDVTWSTAGILSYGVTCSRRRSCRRTPEH